MKNPLTRFWQKLSHLAKVIWTVLKVIGGWFKRRWQWLRRVTKPLQKHGYIWAITLITLVAAQVTLIWAPKVGVYLNAASLAIMVAVAIKQPVARKVAISMGLIPIANMVVISLQPTSIFATSVIYSDTLLALALAYRYIFTLDEPQSRTELKLKGYAIGIPLMIVIGQFIGVIGFIVLRYHYMYRPFSLPLVFLTAVVFAFAEEVLLRGLIQQQGSRVFHPVMAMLTTTVLFVVLSVDPKALMSIPVALLLGFTLALVYYFKQNLILTITLNVAAKMFYLGLVASFILR